MKTVTVNYLHGLASFLDEKRIAWKEDLNSRSQDVITFQIKDDEALFNLGREFGEFREATTS